MTSALKIAPYIAPYKTERWACCLLLRTSSFLLLSVSPTSRLSPSEAVIFLYFSTLLCKNKLLYLDFLHLNQFRLHIYKSESWCYLAFNPLFPTHSEPATCKVWRALFIQEKNPCVTHVPSAIRQISIACTMGVSVALWVRLVAPQQVLVALYPVQTGAAVGAVGGPAGILLGGLAGAILRPTWRCRRIDGWRKVGDVVDEKVLGNFQCGDCDPRFSDR